MISYISPAAIPLAFTHAQARDLGISNRDLAKLTAQGDLQRIARGIYARAGHGVDPDLLELALRSPHTTLCLTTALAHHDLTDEIPRTIDAALPRHHWQPKTGAPVTWHRFDRDTFHIGRDDLHLADTITIAIYSPARSIIDAYRLRHRLGIDLAHTALRRWLNQRGNHPSELLELARSFPRAMPALRAAIETLQ